MREVLEALAEQRSVKQAIVESMADILGIERCAVFKIYRKEEDRRVILCKIVAGIPKNEHKIGLTEEIHRYPDIQRAIETKKVLFIQDPKDNPLTFYFVDAVIEKDINQILYIPIFFNNRSKRTIGVVVLDAIGKRRFSDEEVEFCQEIGRVLSLILEQEEVIVENVRDKFLNKTVGLGGFAERIRKHSQKIVEIISEMEKEIIPKGDMF